MSLLEHRAWRWPKAPFSWAVMLPSALCLRNRSQSFWNVAELDTPHDHSNSFKSFEMHQVNQLDFLFVCLDFNFSCAKAGNGSERCIFSPEWGAWPAVSKGSPRSLYQPIFSNQLLKCNFFSGQSQIKYGLFYFRLLPISTFPPSNV